MVSVHSLYLMSLLFPVYTLRPSGGEVVNMKAALTSLSDRLVTPNHTPGQTSRARHTGAGVM